MFDRSGQCGHSSKTTLPRRRRREISRFLLCGLAALAVTATAMRIANADDGRLNATVNASAYLRLSLADPAAPLVGKDLKIEFDIYRNTQIQLMKNRFVLRAALMQPGVAELDVIKKEKDPVGWLAAHLQTAFPSDAEIMQVAVSGGTPKENAVLVNAVIDAFMNEVVDAERKRIEQRIIELKNIQNGKSEEIKEALSDLRRMADSLGTSDSDALTVRQKNCIEELAAYRAEILRGQVDLDRMKAELASLKALRDAEENAEITELELLQSLNPRDVILEKLGEALVEQEFVGDAKKETKIESIKKKYDQRLEELRVQLRRKRVVEYGRQVIKAEAAVAMTQKQHEVLHEELQKMRKEVDRIGMSSIDMQMRRDEIVRRQKDLDTIVAEIEKLQVEYHKAPRISIIQKADVPR